VLPDVPSIAEFVPGSEAGGWYGPASPGMYPTRSSTGSTGRSNVSLADPKLKPRLSDLGYATTGSSPESMIAREIEKWAKVLKFAGIKPN